MATKKKTEEVTEEVVEEVKETKKKEFDEVAFWNEKVPFRAFKDNDKYSEDIFVGVNGKTFQIKRGEDVMIPRYVYEVIQQADEQRKFATNMQESMQAEYRAIRNRY